MVHPAQARVGVVWDVARIGLLIGAVFGRAGDRLLAAITPARGGWNLTSFADDADEARRIAAPSLLTLPSHPAPTTAFDAFFAENERPLYGYVRRLVGDDNVALDIAQETFVRAWQHFGTIQSYERPAAWLYRVATNLVVSHLRRRVPISLTRVGPHATMPGAARDAHGAFDAGAALVDPNNLAESTAERDLINGVLRRIPERQRAALLLRAVHGFSCDEIATLLDLSPVAARQTLSRGRERFRVLLAAARQDADSSDRPRPDR